MPGWPGGHAPHALNALQPADGLDRDLSDEDTDLHSHEQLVNDQQDSQVNPPEDLKGFTPFYHGTAL